MIPSEKRDYERIEKIIAICNESVEDEEAKIEFHEIWGAANDCRIKLLKSIGARIVKESGL